MSASDLEKQWAEAYLSGGNMAYVDGLYEDYLVDPNSVPEEWQKTFEQLPKLDGDVHDTSHRAIRDHFLNRHKCLSIMLRQQVMVSNNIVSPNYSMPIVHMVITKPNLTRWARQKDTIFLAWN